MVTLSLTARRSGNTDRNVYPRPSTSLVALGRAKVGCNSVIRGVALRELSKFAKTIDGHTTNHPRVSIPRMKTTINSGTGRHSPFYACSSSAKRYHHTCTLVNTVGAKILCRIGIFNHNKAPIKTAHAITDAMSIGSLVSLSGA